MDGSINMAPTWGEIGLLFMRLALSKETAAIKEMRSEVARAMAAAEALSVIRDTLTEEQTKIVSATITRELRKQGF